jgi:hypothetical protein
MARGWVGPILWAEIMIWWPKYGIFPREFSRLNTGTENLVGKTPQPVSTPVSPGFPSFFPVSCFSCENGIWSGNTIFGAGWDRIFPYCFHP